MLRFLLNLLWFVLGGVVMGLGWWLAGLVAAITIVGIPWARACFVIGNYSFWPFGNEAVSRRELTGRGDFGTGPFGLLGNVIWFLLAGWWLAIGHLSSPIASASGGTTSGLRPSWCRTDRCAQQNSTDRCAQQNSTDRCAQ